MSPLRRNAHDKPSRSGASSAAHHDAKGAQHGATKPRSKRATVRGKSAGPARVAHRAAVSDRSELLDSREHHENLAPSGPGAGRAFVDYLRSRVRTFWMRALCFSTVAVLAVVAAV